MRRIMYLSLIFCSLFIIINAQEQQPDIKAGHFDEQLDGIADEDGYCSSEYADEILLLTRDCEISPPEIREPSAPEIFVRELGISLLYKYYEYKYWVWAGAASLCILYLKRRNT